jgi:hypothetical protein
MNSIKVVNKKDHASTDKDFYIGRGSVFGNPFTSQDLDNTKAIYQATSKEDSIKKYEAYLRTRINLKEISIIDGFNEMLEALKMNDINLVCYCAPKDCHGDIIKRILKGMYIKTFIKSIKG